MASVTAYKARSVKVLNGQNPFKLVACDMDGTILNRTHTISLLSRHVILRLLARGVHVIFATGRPFTDVKRIMKQLNILANEECMSTPGIQVCTPHSPNRGSSVESNSSDEMSDSTDSVERLVPRCFAITSNGTCIYDEFNERVYERTIQPEICRELYSMFINDEEVNINVFRSVDNDERRSAQYVNLSDTKNDKANEEWVSRYPSYLEAALYAATKFTFRVIPDLEKTYSTDHVNEIFFLCYNLKKAFTVEEAINERMRDLKEKLRLTSTVRVAPSTPSCLDIIPENVSKASALLYVTKELGITLDECVAFGDGMNDVEMLRAVGKGYVMGNADARVKRTLPDLEVIGTNDEDSVAHTLMDLFDIPALDASVMSVR